jgi:hypothetical protein
MSKTPKSDKFLDEYWPAFVADVTQRLNSGKRVYGDDSFDRPTVNIIGEIQQEHMDVAGWSGIGARTDNPLVRAEMEFQAAVAGLMCGRLEDLKRSLQI